MNALRVRLLNNYPKRELDKDLEKHLLEYAEDLVISVAQDVGINPIARHLFGLYHPSNKIWVAMNEKLSEWNETNYFEFRLRFTPANLSVFRVSFHLTSDLTILVKN